MNKEIYKKDLKELNKMVEDKKELFDACFILAKYFILKGQENKALDIMIKSCTHDKTFMEDSFVELTRLKRYIVKEIDKKYEEELRQLEDTVVHKKYILESCLIMAEYFILNDEREKAFSLMERGFVHDILKFEYEEFQALKKISNDMSCMKDSSAKLTKLKEDAIKIHWKNNKHHPEFWIDYSDMDELDINEMGCDWHARSRQYKTNLIEFAQSRQENRFHFPQEMYNRIMNCCKLLITITYYKGLINRKLKAK